MAERYEVTGVKYHSLQYGRHEHYIEHLCGSKQPSGEAFDLDVDAVIRLLKKRDPDEFYVQKPNLDRVLLHAVAATSNVRAYVTTEPDGRPEDNLLSLPLCAD
jgi:hypothetical protein